MAEHCPRVVDHNGGLAWHDLDNSPYILDHVLLWNVKNEFQGCPSQALCLEPHLVDADIQTFDARLTASSPAIDAGRTGSGPACDFTGRQRDDRPDIGAYE